MAIVPLLLIPGAMAGRGSVIAMDLPVVGERAAETDYYTMKDLAGDAVFHLGRVVSAQGDLSRATALLEEGLIRLIDHRDPGGGYTLCLRN